MDINSEILNSVILAFVCVDLILSILWAFIDREARAILASFLALFSLFITVLQFINGQPWWAGFFALSALFWAIESVDGDSEVPEPEEDSEETEPDNATLREPLVLQVTAVAVDAPKVPSRKVTCPHCGAPNHVFGRSMTDCAYCGSTLA